MMLELDHEGRTLFDRMIEKASGRSCDDAIELMSDAEVRKIVMKIKEKQKKKKKNNEKEGEAREQEEEPIAV